MNASAVPDPSPTTTAPEVLPEPLSVPAFTVIGDESGLSDGAVLTVIDNTSGSGISGEFSNLADGSSFVVGNFSFTADYQGGSGNDLTLTVSPGAAIPEPASVMLLGLGVAGMLIRRRRTV